MANLIGQPVEVMRCGNDDKTLTITKFAQETPGKTDTDHLITRNGRYFLCVQEPIRFGNLTRALGNVSPARLYEKSGAETFKDIEIDILRNHPVQYAGLVFQTESGSDYGVSENHRLMKLTRKSESDGLEIDAIAGIDDEVNLHGEVNYYMRCRMKDELGDFISKNGKAIAPGRFIAMLFKGEEAKKRDRWSYKTSPVDIGGVRPATAEELAKYA